MPLDHGDSRSLRVRQQLKHPVVDADGHTQEYHPIVIDYLRKVGGSALTENYLKQRMTGANWHSLTADERYDRRAYRPPFWTMPAKNTLDLATAMMPNLFRARMDELGIDFAVVYTSQLHFMRERNPELRRAGCRAVNMLNADRFREHSDRMTPAALIPLGTPEEGIEELNFAVKELGFKAIQIFGLVYRSVPCVEREAPQFARYATWIDPLGLDGAHDYDPFWAACAKLRVAPTTHSSGMGWGTRQSISNYTYNHIGHFAAAGEASCKAIFLGGVTRRFPELRFGFLEGGTNWAVSLFNDIVEHWEKRNIKTLMANLDPVNVDRALLLELAREYGGAEYAPYLSDLAKSHRSTGARPGLVPEHDEMLDDWRACQIETKRDIHDLFVPRFFFGCEADDRTISGAFNTKINHFGARLNAIFSSDVSHWDVSDMNQTLAEAHELVDEGLMTDSDFHDFTFANMVRLHGEVNPDFFKGTIVESEAKKVLTDTGTTR